MLNSNQFYCIFSNFKHRLHDLNVAVIQLQQSIAVRCGVRLSLVIWSYIIMLLAIAKKKSDQICQSCCLLHYIPPSLIATILCRIHLHSQVEGHIHNRQ